MTFIEATGVYNNIITMLDNDRAALRVYLMRVELENSQLTGGNTRETERLLKALRVLIDEYKKTYNDEIRRMAISILGILLGTSQNKSAFNQLCKLI